jgi:tetratricopeptide (TPR) repeat protein
VLQMEPTSSWGYRLRCVALGNLGRNEEQIAAARRAVELTPQEPNAYFLLGKALWQTSREVPARGAITRAVELAPDVPLYRFTLAQILFDAEPKRAEDMLRRIVADDPRHAAALNELGVLAQRAGRLKEARTLYERAARADPLLTAARHNLEHVGYPVSRWKLGMGLGVVMLAGPTAGSALAALWVWRDGHSFGALGLAALSALSSLLAVVTFGQALETKRRPRTPLRS